MRLSSSSSASTLAWTAFSPPSQARRKSLCLARVYPSVPRKKRQYERRDREGSLLHQVIREHLQTFLAEAARGDSDRSGVPSFVEAEMRSFLECGVLAHGFARFRCDDCGTDRLVAFSCKGRGFCPSCGGRRMTARAAHLVDEVVPYVPTRQWVLSLPFGLRFRVAFDHDLARAVLAAFTKVIFGFYEGRARQLARG